MKTSHRHYADESGDFNRISRFITEHNAHLRSHSTWYLGRFVDWKYGLWGDKLSAPGFWEKNAYLWFDGFGELAGFAISENVCTHSSFRRRGFARAVIQECLYRLRDMGLRRAYITGYSPEAIALYGSLAAKEGAESLIYRQTTI